MPVKNQDHGRKKMMKNPRTIVLPAMILMAGMLACSAVSNLIATPTPIPTSTPLPTPTPVPGETVLHETEFADSSCFETGGDSEVERYVEDGQFHMKVKTPNLIAWTLCDDLELSSDLILEMDATQVEGPENNVFGLIFRYDLASDEFYNFSIGSDGYYVLTLDGLNLSEPQYIVDWDTSSAIAPGSATNHLKVVVVGDSIEYFVNDQLIGQ